MRTSEWQLLRTKTDETTDDPDWAGLNNEPVEPVGSANIVASAWPWFGSHDFALTGVEVVVLATDANRLPIDRASGTVDLTLVEVSARVYDDPSISEDPLVMDTAVSAAVPLNRKVYFALNGGRWTLRITNDAALPVGTTQLEVWWRPVSR